MRIKSLIIALLFIFFCSCKKDVVVKPIGYPFIERAGNHTIEYQNSKLSFLVSDAANIKLVESNNPGIWFDIVYPQYQATIYCSYLPLSRKTFPDAVEDNYKLVFSHASKADGIKQSVYKNNTHRTTGTIYEIEGNVAVPIQFFVTDSISNFFRGSLYYDTHTNVDSIAPVTSYLREDIVTIIESLKWKD